MSRPQLIRADTLDLQDTDAPSAKDHSRQPSDPAPIGSGPPAPHQATTLRLVAEEQSAEKHQRSPRNSRDLEYLNTLDGVAQREPHSFYEHSTAGLEEAIDRARDEVSSRHNDENGTSGEDSDMADSEGDDLLDDDMMDKISSSPSITDGGYNSTPTDPYWPRRGDSLSRVTPRQVSTPSPVASAYDSSPCVATPIHFPLSYSRSTNNGESSNSHQHHGGYVEEVEDIADEASRAPLHQNPRRASSPYPRSRLEDYYEAYDESDVYENDFDDLDIRTILLPTDSLDFSDDPEEDDMTLPPSPTDSLDTWGSSKLEKVSSWVSEEADNDANDISFSEDTRFVDSGWGGECLREIEDIDFEFVYALHTFTATVEGQANATKGDTMVLLDDSNSYWWLVRVVKDSSIGYLPAEHIETPTERLARLNKHRNLELAQTMLSDAPEKSKNPLKKAMRRRAGKVVQFTAPTYVEASEVEYSSEEEGEDGEVHMNGDETTEGAATVQEEEDVVIEPLKVKSQAKDAHDDSETHNAAAQGFDSEDPRLAAEEEALEPRERNPTSRNGTLRNTDSFFKDDTAETRKITLTPNILRDDSSTSTLDSKELKSRTSFDALEKSISPPDKTREDKRKKEKKGMLSGLFKRKEKKAKTAEDDDATDPKQSAEHSRESPQPRDSEEAATSPVKSTPQRQPSKLQKQPPAELAAARVKSPQPATEPQIRPAVKPPENLSTIESERPKTAPQGASPSTVSLVTEAAETPSEAQTRPNTASAELPRLAKLDTNLQSIRREGSNSGGKFSPITNMLRSSSTASEMKPEKVKKAKKRVELDDFDSSPDAEEPASILPVMQNHQEPSSTSDAVDELTESPIKISPSDAIEELPTPHPPGDFPSESPFTNPPGLVLDTSSQDEPSMSHSPISPETSPEPASTTKSGAVDSVVTTPQSPPSSPPPAKTPQPEWNDVALRSFFDDSEAVRDLLLVVHNQDDVSPAGPDHPLVGGLFVEERKRLKEMNDSLDRLLGDWVGRKQRQRYEERVAA